MSDYYSAVQYPTLTQPVPLAPEDQVNPVWFPQWRQPDPEPVLPVEYRHTLQSVFFVAEPSDFTVIAVPDYGWLRETEQPVLPVEYRHNLESVFAPNFEEIISTDSGVFFESWVQPTSQPVLPEEKRYTYPSVFAQIDENDFVVIVTPDYGWFRPASEPVLPIEYRYSFPAHFWIPPFPASPPTAYPGYIVLSEAVRRNDITLTFFANLVEPAESQNDVDVDQ